MAIIGMFISVAAFLIFFMFFGLMANSGFLSLIMAATAITGFVLAAIGYDKSYKISKKGIQAQKDKLKMIISLYLSFAVALYAFNLLFRRPATIYFVAALPYFLAILVLLILIGVIMTLIKIGAAKRTLTTETKSAVPTFTASAKFCRKCGGCVDDKMKFCIKCGAKIEEAENIDNT
ncbi:MAG: zinc ribbon domain-containing protein, partial [Eubacteriaceae bacterium]|nr:zinc ribbon domain-containing protein [Eubacteriaceae bacterium]